MLPLELRVKTFLECQGAAVKAIPTESAAKKRTPDLLVNFQGLEIVVEIKAIEDNPEEIATLQAVKSGLVVSHSRTDDVKRFSSKIRDANNQLSKKCNGRPGIVLLVDERSFFTRCINPQQVLAEAMFGRQTIWRTAPHPSDPRPSRTVAHDFGLGRTVASNSNTTTSAVALLFHVTGEDYRLLLHHNPHAAAPIPAGSLRNSCISEFVIPDTRQYSHFVELRAPA